MKKIVSFFVLLCLLNGCATVSKYADRQHAPTTSDTWWCHVLHSSVLCCSHAADGQYQRAPLGDTYTTSNAWCSRIREDGIKCVEIKF
jgi:hypothetical protein